MRGKVKLIPNLEFLDLSLSPSSTNDQLCGLAEPPFLTHEVDFLARAAVREEFKPSWGSHLPQNRCSRNADLDSEATSEDVEEEGAFRTVGART